MIQALMDDERKLKHWAMSARAGHVTTCSLTTVLFRAILNEQNLSYRITETHNEGGIRCDGVYTITILCTDHDI